MTPPTRLVSALAACALGVSLLGGATAPVAGAAQPGAGAGAKGIGDPYFPQDGNGGIDVLRYDVRDRYGFASGRLSGRTTLTIRATQGLSRFNLDFLLPVQSVRVDGRAAEFEQGGDHELRIKPHSKIDSGEQLRVVVRYDGTPASESSQGESNWLASDTEVVAMNQPHMATWWFPANDHPLDKAAFDIRITVPRGKDVIANGTLVDRRRHGAGLMTTHWRSTEPMATYLAFFAAGSYDVEQGSYAGRPWYVAVSDGVPAGLQDEAMALMRRSGEVTAWLESVVGPYPFSSTGGLVTGLDPGFALENQTRPTYPPIGASSLSLVVHELAHQWFGDSVSVAGWRDIWLNEGFAQFFEVYYAETHGAQPGQTWLQQTYDRYAANPAFWSLRIDDPGRRHIFDTPIYDRGAMAVQALRHRIGDAAFWPLIQAWVSQHRYGNAAVADFQALAETVSGQELDGFFDAWLRGATPPARTAENGF